VYLFANRRLFLLSLAAASSFGNFLSPPQPSDVDDHVYEPGGDVKPPRILHYVEPEFSPSSKEAYVEGVVKISTIVTTDGKATECRISSGLSTEEDRTAVEALQKWTFHPGTRNDKPVKVHITVEIDFHLL
jgi:periplasmic protein TonB